MEKGAGEIEDLSQRRSGFYGGQGRGPGCDDGGGKVGYLSCEDFLAQLGNDLSHSLRPHDLRDAFRQLAQGRFVEQSIDGGEIAKHGIDSAHELATEEIIRLWKDPGHAPRGLYM